MASFPPLRSHPSTPITSDLALQKLQEYLSATNSNPYLLPNATLQSDGPRAASDSSSNLVIHNLKRVEAGLRGEWLEPSLDLESEGHGVVSLVGGGKGTGQENMAVEEGNGEGWQDLDEYQREQSVEGGEIGERHTGIGQEGDEAIHPAVDVRDEGISEEMRKKLRREAKKARKEKEKRERVHKKGK
jgi:hypothetical protein